MRMLIGMMLLLVGLGALPESSAQTEQASIGKPTGSFCAILVPNAQESARWYRDYLGFAITRTSGGPNGASRTIMMEQGGVLLEIIEVRDSFALQQVTAKNANRLQGIRKFGIVVEKAAFDGLLRRLAEKKATFVGGVFADDGLKMESFIVSDNYGNLVQFFSPIKA